jgi:hypothetical protein
MEPKRLHRGVLLLLGLCLAAWLPAEVLAAPAPAPAAPVVAPAAPAAPAAAPSVAAPAGVEVPPEMAKLADEVALKIQDIRGWKFKQPVVKRLLTEKEAHDFMAADFARENPPEQVALKQATLKVLGFLPPDTDLVKTFLDLMGQQAEAFYDPQTKVLYMVRHNGAKAPSAVDRIVLSHELEHALDDQQADLGKFVKSRSYKSEDDDLVTGAILEGSATAAMMRYMMQLQLSGGIDLAEIEEYSKQDEARNQAFFEAPRYFLSLLGSYMVGLNFLTRGNLMNAVMVDKAVGPELMAAVKDPPRSTEQVIHCDKYWDPSKRDEPVLVKDADVEKLLALASLAVIHKDTVGEMLCAILTTPKDTKPNMLTLALASGWTNAAATGWGGDRFYLLTNTNGGKPVADTFGGGVWITLWDTEKDRDEFVEALQTVAPAPNRVTFKWGKQGAVFFFNFNEASRKAIEAALDKSPPAMTKDGKPWTP